MQVGYEDFRKTILTKDEVTVADALLALAKPITNTDLNTILEVKLASVPRESMYMKPKYEENNTNNSNGKMSQKRGPIHLYICRFIMGLQLANPQNQYSVCFDGHLSTPIIKQCHSQWSTKILSNPYQYSGFYQTWQNQRDNTMAPITGSSIQIFGVKCMVGSL